MDLLSELADARSSQGLSQAALAERIGLPRLAITRLESGTGSVATLLAAMAALEFRVAGVGRAPTLTEQLAARRKRLGWSIEETARRAGLDPRTIASVESGGGTVASLVAMLSVIAPRAKRSSPPRSSWSYDWTGLDERDKRFTPKWFFAHIVEAFGSVDIDPCGHEQSAVLARRRIILPECGLASSWAGHRLAYVNPPYSAVSTWMARASHAWDQREVETIVMLVPARTDSAVFQERVSRDADVLFLAGRIRFESTEGLAWPAPFSLMIVIWGAEETAIQRFRALAPSVRMKPWGARLANDEEDRSAR